MGGKHWHSRQQRGYDDRWLRARRLFLQVNPYCLGCHAALGKLEPATIVDHIVPHYQNQNLFWDPENWQPTCAFHHDSIKARLENLWQAKRIKNESLRLDSPDAIKLTKRLKRVAVGVDGLPLEN